MEIDQHDISFRTAHSSTEKHTKKETFVFATRGGRQRVQRTTDGEGNTEVDRQSHIRPDRVEVSEEGREASESKKSKDKPEFELTVQQKMELKLIHLSFKQIFAGKFEFLDPEEFLEDLEEAQEGELTGKEGEGSGNSEQTPAEAEGNEGADFGFSYEYEETHFESEKLTFEAEGNIKTADGKEISFNMDMNISRRFFEKTSVSIQGGNAKLIDPLVVNFDGTAAELSESNFSFDVNVDGVEEKIAKLEPGSGFLALDKNGNGEIDDGSELFGPETGKGFEELAEHDGDKNRFIDEGDDVFDELMLLTSNHSGEQSLISLKEAGVGAIFLGSADTEFSYKSHEDNELQGQLERSGVFIGEDGSVGSVQKINLAARGESSSNVNESPDGESNTSDQAERFPPGRARGLRNNQPFRSSMGTENQLRPRFAMDGLSTPGNGMPLNSVLSNFTGGGILSGMNFRA